jgi:hypothetical protein
METATKAVEAVADAVPDAVTQAAAVVSPSGTAPPQRQDQPGVEADMHPAPEFVKAAYKVRRKQNAKAIACIPHHCQFPSAGC